MRSIKYHYLFFIGIIYLLGCNKENKEVEYYPNGNIKYEVPIVDSLRHGRYISFFENGDTQKVSVWEKGVIVGETVEYFPDGNIFTECSYVDSTFRGSCIEYDSLGNKFKEFEVYKEQKHGDYTEFHPNGQLMFDGFYLNDIIDGEAVEYYSDGSIYQKLMYQKGHLEYLKAFDENGRRFQYSLPIEIKPVEKKESYHLNKPHEVTIKLKYSDNLECGMLLLFGNANSNGILLDTLDHVISTNRHLEYSFIPKHVGINKVEGVLCEIMWMDSLGNKDYYNHKYFRVTAQDYFKYEFFVEGANM